MYYKELVKFLKIPTFESEPEKPKILFRLIGIVCNKSFQKCRCYIESLCKSCPDDYTTPDIKPMLSAEWNEFIIKARRKVGSEKIHALRKDVAIFIDGDFLGDDVDLVKYITKRYKIYISKNFEQLGNEELIDYLRAESELGRTFLYFTISIDDKVIGSLLFKLYMDLVPGISEVFAKRCYKKTDGFVGTPIQRIVLPGWIQCGGWGLKHVHIPCENYIIPHDRRGILSICNNGKHTDNSTQFCISLGSTPWMDYKYVAFGQLIHGDEVLKIIERVPTHYEAPKQKILIVNSGEFTFYPSIDIKSNAQLQKFLTDKAQLEDEVIDPRDVKSELLRRRHKLGFYFEKSDLKSYKPFSHLPGYLLYKQLCDDNIELNEEEEMEHNITPKSIESERKSKNFECKEDLEEKKIIENALCLPFGQICTN